MALSNHQRTKASDNVQFLLMDAKDYEVSNKANFFYFFNPFSVEIFKLVFARIKASWDAFLRKLTFFYYPFDEYLYQLVNLDELKYMETIDCNDLFE